MQTPLRRYYSITAIRLLVTDRPQSRLSGIAQQFTNTIAAGVVFALAAVNAVEAVEKAFGVLVPMSKSTTRDLRTLPGLRQPRRIDQLMTEPDREQLLRPIPTRYQRLHVGEQIVTFYEVDRQIGGDGAEHQASPRHPSQLGDAARNHVPRQLAQAGLDHHIEMSFGEGQRSQIAKNIVLLQLLRSAPVRQTVAFDSPCI